MDTSLELTQLVTDWFAAATRGDSSQIDDRVASSAHVRLIGSDPDEWLEGGAQVSAFLRGEVEGAGGRVTFTPADTEAFEHGDVGWAATKLTISLPDGKRITPRWSAVFLRIGGSWQFVQTHASIPVRNDQVGWSYD
jgi:ketosteroid isomerase-like protein